MIQWHAIYVKSRSEKKVADALIKNNINTYLPILKTMRQWSDRKKMVEVPLLNGYVFVNITAKEKEKVLFTKGVVGFVKHCSEIAIIPENQISQLKQLIELGYVIETNQLEQKLHIGDKIKITSGPLKNIEGYILQNDEGKFIEVLLESIGQVIKVKLPKEILLGI